MISIAEAQARLIALAAPVAIQTVPLIEAAGRWAAESVIATRTQPARDLSAMDGYAIQLGSDPKPTRVPGRVEGLPQPSEPKNDVSPEPIFPRSPEPVEGQLAAWTALRQAQGYGVVRTQGGGEQAPNYNTYTVIGESAAGRPFIGTITSGQAARIFTGAAVPDGANTIIIQEDVTRTGDQITAHATPGAHIRRAGSDFATGDVLIEPGTHLTPARIALAAMGGHGTLAVRRRVRVALISTGDELVPPGIDPGPDHLPASNSPMLASLIRTLPVSIIDLGIVADTLPALAAAFDAARDCDIIVTTGGASVGDHDLVRPALLAAGAVLDFWRVAMRPGKPLLAGRLGDAVVLGLPGNPASAFVTATLFLCPLIAALSGARDPFPRSFTARLGADLPVVGNRTDFVRARWVDGALCPLPSSDSGVVVPLAAADALIVRDLGAPALAAGSSVQAIALA